MYRETDDEPIELIIGRYRVIKSTDIFACFYEWR